MMVIGPCQVIVFDLHRLRFACVLAQTFVNIKTIRYTGEVSGLCRDSGSIGRCSSLQYLYFNLTANDRRLARSPLPSPQAIGTLGPLGKFPVSQRSLFLAPNVSPAHSLQSRLGFLEIHGGPRIRLNTYKTSMILIA